MINNRPFVVTFKPRNNTPRMDYIKHINSAED